MSKRWHKRPEGSNWGDFGADDQIGRLNLITADSIKRAAAEVREGRCFCLSLPLDFPGGNEMNKNRHPPILRPCLREGDVNMNYQASKQDPNSRDVLSDDLVILHLQYSTQWDALSHVGSEFDIFDDGSSVPVYYNGYRAHEDIISPESTIDCGINEHVVPTSTSTARALGIENMAEACVQGRGVMVDLRRHFGDSRTKVGFEQLMQIMASDGIDVKSGDILCLHTGLAELILKMDKKLDLEVVQNSCAVLDGNDPALLEWIDKAGISAIASDNYAVEDVPAKLPNANCTVLPLHHLCLFKLGIHLGELWHLTPLADWLFESNRNSFLLTAPPLRLPGAVGSPVTPVATV